LRDERGLGLDWNAPELAKSAKKHAGVESDNVDDLDRMWPQVISPLKAEVENRKTPDLVMVGGLKDNRLVGQIAQLSNLPECESQRSDGSKSAKPCHPRQRQVRLDCEEVQELCAMYKKGASLRDLEMTFGVHRDTAAKHLENHGISRRLGGPRRLTDKQVQWARKRRTSGESIRSIAESLGIGQTTLRMNLKSR